METSTNDLRSALDGESTALGALDNTYSPALVELYGDLGLDFVWIDLEHAGPSPWDGPALDNLLRAAERSDTELLVRVPTTEPGLVRKALDAGVRNVFLSRVHDAADVEAAVRAARFEYDGEPGERGLASPRARRWGGVEDYVGTEDRETLVGVTIETKEAVENIEDILAVPELGFVFAGPLDLSVALGHPDELDHPEVAAAIETIEDATRDSEVGLAGLGFGPEDVNAKAQRGYDMLNLGSTTGALRGAVGSWLDDFEGTRSQ